jgi:hypothetical protein
LGNQGNRIIKRLKEKKKQTTGKSRRNSWTYEPILRLYQTCGYFKERVQPGSVIAIDGKTVKGSASESGKAIHLVSAWANELGFAPGQVKTDKKSNEITAIPQLLLTLQTKVRGMSETNCGLYYAGERGLCPFSQRKPP